MTLPNNQNAGVNSVIAEALSKAGVTELGQPKPPEPAEGAPVEPIPNLDGTLKGETKGEPGSPIEPVSETPVVEPVPAEPVSGDKVVPLGKEDLVAFLDEASSKFQSIMDRKINSIAAQMQTQSSALTEFFRSQDEASLASLSPEEQTLKRLERLEKSPVPAAQPPHDNGTSPDYNSICASVLQTVGLKPSDERLDWAKEAGITPEIGFTRFLGSVQKAFVEDQTTVLKTLKDTGDKAIAAVRKKAGVDEVPNKPPGGNALPDIDKLTPLQKLEYAYSQAEVTGNT